MLLISKLNGPKPGPKGVCYATLRYVLNTVQFRIYQCEVSIRIVFFQDLTLLSSSSNFFFQILEIDRKSTIKYAFRAPI